MAKPRKHSTLSGQPAAQAFPHGSVASTGGMSGPEAEHKEHTGLGEKMAEGIASTDQVRPAMHHGLLLTDGMHALFCSC